MLLTSLCSLLLAASVLAQTLTTTDADGNTIIQDVTIDPVLGVPTTVVIETIPAGQLPTSSDPLATSTLTPLPATSIATPTSTPVQATATTAAQQPAGQQGPVGAPAPIDGPAGPYTYTYTTTDAAGDVTAIAAVFTPTAPATIPFTPTGTGTVLDYSSYIQMLGTHTVPVEFSASTRLVVSRSLLGGGVAVTLALAGGFRLVFA